MKCLIIDDEEMAIKVIENHISRISGLEVAGVYSNAMDAFAAMQDKSIDLLFLDIQMPRMSGLSMLQMLSARPHVILTTAHREFALDGFNLDVVDYLLKPIDTNDLKEAIRKASEKIQQKSGTDNISNLLQNIKKPEVNQRIAVPGREGYEFIEAGKIIYAKAEGSYTHVFLNDKRKLIISKTLSDIEELLPAEHFQRIHHSTLVNLSHVTHLFKTDGGFVVLDNGEKLVVSKSKKDSLMERLGLK